MSNDIKTIDGSTGLVQSVERPDESMMLNSLLSQAVAQDWDVDRMQRLIDMRNAELARQAKLEFNEAMRQFRSLVKPIEKNRTAKIKTLKGGEFIYKFADLGHVCATIDPLLQQCGLSYTWEGDMGDGGNTVVIHCIVTHSGGHEHRAGFPAIIDKGNNAISGSQQIASAMSFARRNALILALGLSTTEDDDDGASAGRQEFAGNPKADSCAPREKVGGKVNEGKVRPGQLSLLNTLCDERDLSKQVVCDQFGTESLDKIPASKMNEVMQWIKGQGPAKR